MHPWHSTLHSSVAEISSKNLLNNLAHLQRQAPNSKLLPMVKANAYGHGIEIIQNTLQPQPIAGLGVSSITEAIHLRQCGYPQSIVCFGRISQDILQAASNHGITVTLHCADDIALFAHSSHQPDFHLEIETGMHRLGLQADDILAEQKNWMAIRHCAKGIFTHLSQSENLADRFSQVQMQHLAQTIQTLNFCLPPNLLRHISNSGSIIGHAGFDLDWARPGIALFGYDPLSPQSTPLKPVLCWKAPIIQIKDLQAGDAVSYGRTFIADKAMKIATIPVGYGDGFARSYQNIGVGYQNKRLPIIGRICMDLMMIDITTTTNPQLNDDVYLLGDGDHGEANAYELAKVDQTICYEVLSRIGSRVLRVQV